MKMKSFSRTLRGMCPAIRVKETFSGDTVKIECLSDDMQFFFTCSNTFRDRMTQKMQMINYVIHHRKRHGLTTFYSWTLGNPFTQPVEVLPGGAIENW